MSSNLASTQQFTPSLDAAGWQDLPQQAWRDIQESIGIAWQAWVGLFPDQILWDPLGAALSLGLGLGIIIWLIRVRPG